jgi:hypothetical protein
VDDGAPSFVEIKKDGSGADYETTVAARQALGLSVSDEALKAAARASDAEPELRADFGFDLTYEERLQILAKEDLDRSVLKAQADFMVLYPEHFAGIEVDHADGDVVNVWMTKGPSEDSVRKVLPTEATVVVREATRSLNDLTALSDQIAETLRKDEWMVGTTVVDAVSINVQANSVEIHVDPSLAAYADDVLAAFPHDAVNVLVTDRKNSTYVGNTNQANAGGQTLIGWIGGGTVDPTSRCSTSFPATRGGANTGVTSALHCAGAGYYDYWTTRAPDYQNVGGVRSQSYNQANGVEAAFLGFRDMTPKVWYPRSNDWDATLTVRYGWSNGLVSGVPFHFTAAYTNTRYFNYGGISSFDTTVDGFSHFQAGYACAQSGDSGGPVYSLSAEGGAEYISAAGIASYSSDSSAACTQSETIWWQRTSRALPALGATLITG